MRWLVVLNALVKGSSHSSLSRFVLCCPDGQYNLSKFNSIEYLMFATMKMFLNIYRITAGVAVMSLNASAYSDLRLGSVFDMIKADGTINAESAVDISAYLMAIDDANLRYKSFLIRIKTAVKNSGMRFSDSSVAGKLGFMRHIQPCC